MHKNSLFTMNDLSVEEFYKVLEDGQRFADEPGLEFPKAHLVANLFFEPSTRTHYSFASAQQQLGCRVEDFSASGSSVQKGESLYDTIKTFEAIGYEAVVIRHTQEEYFKELENINIPILNGGDGKKNHPTQCLLDLLTIYQEFGKFEGLRVVIVGDIAHSRVAHSNRDAMVRLGCDVRFSGPADWVDDQSIFMDIDEAVKWADVVMLLRIQHERHEQSMKLSKEAYLQKYGLTYARVEAMKEHAIIMHPAPVNRGVEIESDLVEHPKSRIFKQITNGVHVRKALMKRAFGYAFTDMVKR